MAIDTIDEHEALIGALLDARRWPQGGRDRQRIDTHISTVVLAGDCAYKIKKPLDLGFLDFRSLDARKAACDEELRLNSRLAPTLYQSVCAITGSVSQPTVDGVGEAIDWAVRMRRFDPDAVLSNPAIPIDESLIDDLAQTVAHFHVCADLAAPATAERAQATGDMPEMKAVLANFERLRELGAPFVDPVKTLESWTVAHAGALRPVLQWRREHGCIRECHGDLHLGNIALIEGEAVVFDAIEFDPDLRWIDVANDIAFLTMDLCQRDMQAMAFRFIDAYLSIGGDYALLRVLRFYEVYRALVRAKISAIRMQQVGEGDERDVARQSLQRYLALAQTLAQTRRGALLITHGVSGSGKSYASAGLAQRFGGVRLRSDVERKRLLGLAADADATDRGGYGAEVTRRTYQRLAELAETVIGAGYTAIVDATFLVHADRARFAQLAKRCEVPFAILDCSAAPEVLRARITARQREMGNVSDADLAVLERQLERVEPLSAGERAVSLPITPDVPLDLAALQRMLGSTDQSA